MIHSFPILYGSAYRFLYRSVSLARNIGGDYQAVAAKVFSFPNKPYKVDLEIRKCDEALCATVVCPSDLAIDIVKYIKKKGYRPFAIYVDKDLMFRAHYRDLDEEDVKTITTLVEKTLESMKAKNKERLAIPA